MHVLTEHIAMNSVDSPSETPVVSVVIPVYNDLTPLRQCLQALRDQTYPKERYRVSVVDNASDEDIGSVVEDFECARLLYESRQGSYAARNRGIRESKGEIIAFTDADCLPGESWIEEGVRRLTEGSSCDVVGGRIDFCFQTPQRPTPVELFDAAHYLNQKQYVHQQHFAATANAFTWARLFKKVGLFDETLQSGGDTEWGQRAYRHEYNICYAESARVQHPARSSYRALRRKKLRIVEGTVHSRKEEGYPLGDLGRDVAKDVGHHVKFALRVVIQEQYSWRDVAKLLVAFPYQGVTAALRRTTSWFRSK